MQGKTVGVLETDSTAGGADLLRLCGDDPFRVGGRHAGKVARQSSDRPRTSADHRYRQYPLGGLGLPLNQIPSNVQTADSEQMQRRQGLGLADYLNNNFSGVNVSESADNPFQLDIN
jgi:hypothetical protein